MSWFPIRLGGSADNLVPEEERLSHRFSVEECPSNHRARGSLRRFVISMGDGAQNVGLEEGVCGEVGLLPMLEEGFLCHQLSAQRGIGVGVYWR